MGIDSTQQLDLKYTNYIKSSQIKNDIDKCRQPELSFALGAECSPLPRGCITCEGLITEAFKRVIQNSSHRTTFCEHGASCPCLFKLQFFHKFSNLACWFDHFDPCGAIMRCHFSVGWSSNHAGETSIKLSIFTRRRPSEMVCGTLLCGQNHGWHGSFSCWLLNYINFSGSRNVAYSANERSFPFAPSIAKNIPRTQRLLLSQGASSAVDLELATVGCTSGELEGASLNFEDATCWFPQQLLLFLQEFCQNQYILLSQKNAQDTCNLAIAIFTLHHHLYIPFCVFVISLNTTIYPQERNQATKSRSQASL